MARPLRVEYPGAFYHVINRGNNQENIFKNKRDREKFLEYLAIAAERFSIVVHTYCLMNNHYHLLVQTPEPNLSMAVQWINVSYATYFNRKRGRTGHLFRGRFKAILVDADEYLKHLSRYIHLNPVRAKLVANPKAYDWSSYRAFIVARSAPAFLEIDWLLSHFGKSKKVARRKYAAFVESADIRTLENPNKQVTAGFILGDQNFVNWVKDTFLSGRQDDTEIPQLRKLKPKVSPEDIVMVVSNAFACSVEQIVTKGRKNNKPREMAIHLSRDLSGLSCRDLGTYFGGVSGALITVMHKRVEQKATENRRLRNKIKKIKKQILNI